MDTQVIVVGSYVQDHAWLTERFPEAGETRRATGFNTGPGGKGFNQAVACHRQGVETAFVGAIGKDHLGKMAREFAQQEQLACAWQQLDDQSTAASSIVVDAQGENRIVVNLAANEHLDPVFVRQSVAARRGAAILLVQLENNLDAIAAAVAEAQGAGLKVVMNPAPVHPQLDANLLRRCTMIAPNETELALLLARCTGREVAATDLARMADQELHTLCRSLKVPTVVVTLGQHGCFVSHQQPDALGDQQAYYREAAAQAAAIDSTGAGDAFNGALVAAMIRLAGQPFRDAVIHANRAAALATEVVGTATVMVDFEAVGKRYGSSHDRAG